MKKLSFLLIFSLLLCGCGQKASEIENNGKSDEPISTIINDEYEDYTLSEYEVIKFENNTINTENDQLLVSDNTLTIKNAGTYVLEGKLENGQIIVDVEEDEDIRIVLNNVEILGKDDAIIKVLNGHDCIITLAKDSINTLTTKNTFNNQTEAKSTIYSEIDLKLEGSGTLNVINEVNDGIVSKDDLFILEGNYDIQAADDGLVGKDSVRIKTGNITINSLGDGIKSSNDKDSDKGYVLINDGNININSQKDGIQATYDIVINGGDINIVSGNGSDETKIQSSSNNGFDGRPAMNPNNNFTTKPEKGDGTNFDPSQKPQENMDRNQTNKNEETKMEEDNSVSTKGIKSDAKIIINSGKITIDSLDDCLHSYKLIEINNGDLLLKTNDDAMHSDTNLVVNDGNIDIDLCYEGIEAQNITINSGIINIYAKDDGINAASSSNIDEKDLQITINNGNITIDCLADGIDSNGNLTINNGNIIMYGPSSGPDGGFDVNQTFLINGGNIISLNINAMFNAPDSNSKQFVICNITNSFSKTLTILDSNDNVIAQFESPRDFNTITYSSSELEKNKSYKLKYDNYEEEITISDTINGNYINQMQPHGNGREPKQ